MTPSVPSLLPRLLIAAGLLRALSHLRRLLSVPPHTLLLHASRSDLSLHEGIEATCEALDRLAAALPAPSIADAQREAIYMDCPEPATLDVWAGVWSDLADHVATGLATAGCDAAPSQLDTLVSL